MGRRYRSVARAVDRGGTLSAIRSERRTRQPATGDNWRVFYFFKKGNDTVTCEVRTSSTGPGFDIVIIEADGTVRTETHPTSEAVHKRWLEVLERFQRDGWWGHHIQDGRS